MTLNSKSAFVCRRSAFNFLNICRAVLLFDFILIAYIDNFFSIFFLNTTFKLAMETLTKTGLMTAGVDPSRSGNTICL